MTEDLENGLRKLGLDEKQAKVYLAALELGPSPVQKIAQRASVPRATTYLVLDDLRNQGLVSTFEKGKKTYFAAESPERLKTVVEQKEVEISNQRAALNQIIPDLTRRAQFKHGEHKTAVKFYEGIESMKASLRDDFKHTGEEILNIFNMEKVDDIFRKIDLDDDKISKMRKRAKIKRRIIYTTADDKPYEQYKKTEAIHVLKDSLPLTADITIIGDSVSLVPYDEPIRGIAINDPAIAESLRSVFNLLWSKYRQ